MLTSPQSAFWARRCRESSLGMLVSFADYLNGAGAPPAPGAGVFVQGTVTDNADKNQPGMVKVEFTGWKTGSRLRLICE